MRRYLISVLTVIALLVSGNASAKNNILEQTANQVYMSFAYPETGEVIQDRTETSVKTYLGRGQYLIQSYSEPVHYKDVSGNWQRIDPAYSIPDSGNYTTQFTKLPYLVRVNDDGTRRIYPDRNDLTYWLDIGKPFPNMGAPVKIGNTWTWDFTNAQIKVSILSNQVKFNAILKNALAPTSLTIPFSATGITRNGSILYHNGQQVAQLARPYAVDANGVTRNITAVFNAGSVTISVNTSGLAFPIDVDPTVTVQTAASTDDGLVEAATSYFSATSHGASVGRDETTYIKYGGTQRFLNITVPSGATISSANMTLKARTSLSGTTVNSRIRAENTATPATYSNWDNFNARTWTTAYTNWDSIPATTSGNNFTTADFASSVQEVINLAGWSSGHNISILIDDFELRSTQSGTVQRNWQQWDSVTGDGGPAGNQGTMGPVLNIVYSTTPPVTSTWIPQVRIF